MENIGHMGYSPHQSNFSAQLDPLHENPSIYALRLSFASTDVKYETWLVWDTL